MFDHTDKKTMIGVLASHDSVERNNSLARLFERLYSKNTDLLGAFHFLFTGGTYERILIGTKDAKALGIEPIKEKVRNFLMPRATCLPSRLDGGVTVLAYSVVQRQCSILWPFLTPLTAHWLNPENLALMRLSDQWHAKRLMNSGSVEEWFQKEAEMDRSRNLQPCPLSLELGATGPAVAATPRFKAGFHIERPATLDVPESFEKMTIALIAHDEMKARIVDFAIDYEAELARFYRILSTGTTGREVGEATRRLNRDGKVYRYHSGPKGGDIEIATEILFGRCHVVIFFIDPLHPHPHIEDIRVVFGACMIQDKVRMLTNEMQAREWMDRVVKR